MANKNEFDVLNDPLSIISNGFTFQQSWHMQMITMFEPHISKSEYNASTNL